MRALAVRLRSEGAYAVAPIMASGDGAMWRVLRRDGMKSAAQLIEFIVGQRDDGRATDLADGVQIDVSEIAREAGLKFPVYLTRAVWESYVRVSDGVRCQDEKGRLWDIVWMLRCAARRTSGQIGRAHV